MKDPYTPQSNMEPEKKPFQEGRSLERTPFQVPYWFGRVYVYLASWGSSQAFNGVPKQELVDVLVQRAVAATTARTSVEDYLEASGT